MALLALKPKIAKYKTAKYSFEFSYTIKNKWTHIQSMLVYYRQKPTFELWSFFQRRRNHILKGATIKGKNMLPIGGIFFHFKVARMMKVNNLKGHFIEKPSNLDAAKIKCFTIFYVATQSS